MNIRSLSSLQPFRRRRPVATPLKALSVVALCGLCVNIKAQQFQTQQEGSRAATEHCRMAPKPLAIASPEDKASDMRELARLLLERIDKLERRLAELEARTAPTLASESESTIKVIDSAGPKSSTASTTPQTEADFERRIGKE